MDNPSYTNQHQLSYSICDGTYLVEDPGGGSSYGELWKDTFNLPAHSSVFLTLEMWFLDNWAASDGLYLSSYNAANTISYFNGQIAQLEYNAASWSSNLCGDSSFGDLKSVIFTVQFNHDLDYFYLHLRRTNSNNGNFNLRNVKIQVSNHTLAQSFSCGYTTPANLLSSGHNCACEMGQFYDSVASKCSTCDSSCAICFGSSSSECASCAEGYVYDGTACVPCDKSCKNCNGPLEGQCTSCAKGYLLYGSYCLSCHPTCETCFGIKSNQCLSCAADLYLDSNSTCSAYPASTFSTQTQAVQDVLQNITKQGIVIVYVMSLVNPSIITIGLFEKMLQYIRYIDVSYSQELIKIFHDWDSSWLSLNFGIEIPDEIGDGSSYHRVPSIFSDYQVSGNFLQNFWENTMALGILGLLVSGLWGLEYFVAKKNSQKSQKLFSTRLRIMAQNFLISQFYIKCGDIIFFFVIQAKAFWKSTALSVSSLLISVVLVLITLAFLGFHFWLINKYQKFEKKKGFEDFCKKNEGMKILFEKFKDSSMLSQSFLLIFVIKDLASSVVLTTLFISPLSQIVIITTMNVLMIIYLIWKRPFREIIDGIEQLVYESLLLCANLCVFILAISDGEARVEKVSRAIIIINIIFNFCAIVFLLIGLVTLAKHLHKIWEEKTIQNILPNSEEIKRARYDSILQSPKDTVKSPTGAQLIVQSNSASVLKLADQSNINVSNIFESDQDDGKINNLLWKKIRRSNQSRVSTRLSQITPIP